MKKIIVKRMSLRGIFTGVIAFIGIPITIMGILMIFSMASNGYSKENVMGTLCFLLITPFIYAGIAMIFGISYNFLAPRIGGFRLEIEEEGDFLESGDEGDRRAEIDKVIEQENMRRDMGRELFDKEGIKKDM